MANNITNKTAPKTEPTIMAKLVYLENDKY